MIRLRTFYNNVILVRPPSHEVDLTLGSSLSLIPDYFVDFSKTIDDSYLKCPLHRPLLRPLHLSFTLETRLLLPLGCPL